MARDTTVLTAIDVLCGNCDELRSKFNIPETVHCCSSCHFDAAEGIARMDEYEDEDEIFVGCCSVLKIVYGDE